MPAGVVEGIIEGGLACGVVEPLCCRFILPKMPPPPGADAAGVLPPPNRPPGAEDAGVLPPPNSPPAVLFWPPPGVVSPLPLAFPALPKRPPELCAGAPPPKMPPVLGAADVAPPPPKIPPPLGADVVAAFPKLNELLAPPADEAGVCDPKSDPVVPPGLFPNKPPPPDEPPPNIPPAV